MYKEYPRFYNYETLDYGRKSRTDDPLLSVEEVLDKHDKIIEEYAEKYLGGPIPEENKYREVGSAESLDSRPEILRLLKAIENPAIKAVAVVEVQRLSRGDLEDAGRLIRILRYTNITGTVGICSGSGCVIRATDNISGITACCLVLIVAISKGQGVVCYAIFNIFLVKRLNRAVENCALVDKHRLSA